MAQTNSDLWLAYASKLKDSVVPGGLGSKQRFYFAPLSAAGIAAGPNIHESIKNFGVFTIGDTLLDLDSPAFAPSRKSYVEKMNL